MSVFVVSPQHIVQLILGQNDLVEQSGKLPFDLQVEVAKTLIKANHQSVANQNGEPVYQNIVNADIALCIEALKQPSHGLPAVQILKMAECLMEQLAKTSNPYAWDLAHNMFLTAKHALPGYSAAQWEYTQAARAERADRAEQADRADRAEQADRADRAEQAGTIQCRQGIDLSEAKRLISEQIPKENSQSIRYFMRKNRRLIVQEKGKKTALSADVEQGWQTIMPMSKQDLDAFGWVEVCKETAELFLHFANLQHP